MSKMGGRKAERKEVDNFYRLSKHAMAFQEGLQFWADQTMKPESREEAEYAMVVRNAAASIIPNYARLGVDVVGIYDTFYKEEENGRTDGRQIGA
jgi:hypothetical protein